jgi:catechol 2,3-dioxygenase-like lactoylglutathione lyase family enzyme
MTPNPQFSLNAVTLDSPDAPGLARFYQRLLGGTLVEDEPEWVVLRLPGGGVRLAFQQEPAHVRPTWPAGPGDQQMMMHLEIRVDDLHGSVPLALAAGATVAEYQPQDDVRVCLDPAGHPFCLFVEDQPDGA